MRVYLLRHGRTAYNDTHRYQGVGDIPLSPAGEAELVPADFRPETVWVSPLSRARRTAEILFPGVRQTAVEDLREMDFGAFEGRNYREMARDAAYRAWVDGGCRAACPGGESREAFSRRVCAAFSVLLRQSREQGAERLVVVAHGGVQMAVLERYALPRRAYFDWQAPCGGGYVLEADPGRAEQPGWLHLLDTVCYGGGERGC